MKWDGKERRKTQPLSLTLDIGENFSKLLTGLIVKPGTGNTEVLAAVNNLTKLVKEIHMALKDDVKALTDQIGSIEEGNQKTAEAVQLIADDVTALKKEIADANEKSNVDLSPLVQRAANIAASSNAVSSKLREIAGPNAGSDLEAPPPPGGETGGTEG
jgi:methyl-accepting chemotaxis protein